MRICYFSTYEPSYPRRNIVVEGLRKNGVEVVECISNRKNRVTRAIPVLLKFLFKKRRCDIIYVGMVDHHMMFPIKLFSRKKIIFDPYISIYDTLILDRKRYKPESFIAKLALFVDKYSYKKSDRIAYGSYEDINFFSRWFRLPQEQFFYIPVSADTRLFYPRDVKKDKEKFIVWFHGKFIPAQGVEYIIRAAKLLEAYKNISFKLVGKGLTLDQCKELAKELDVKNLEFIDFIPIEQLPEKFAYADVGLGLFGDTGKAQRAIANKVYEALAMKIPVITGDTPAARELLKHRENAMLVKMADEKSLAENILELYKDRKLRERLAENGYKSFINECTPEKIGKKIKEVAEELLNKKTINAP